MPPLRRHLRLEIHAEEYSPHVGATIARSQESGRVASKKQLEDALEKDRILAKSRQVRREDNIFVKIASDCGRYFCKTIAVVGTGTAIYIAADGVFQWLGYDSTLIKAAVNLRPGSILLDIEPETGKGVADFEKERTEPIELNLGQGKKKYTFCIDSVKPISLDETTSDAVVMEAVHKITRRKHFKTRFSAAVSYRSSHRQGLSQNLRVCYRGHVRQPVYTPNGWGSKRRCGRCKAFV